MSSDSEMIQFDIKTEENNEIPVFNKPNINHFSCSEILKVSCSYSDVVEGFKNLSVSVPIITYKMKDSEALKIILSEIEILEETIFKLENSKKLKLIKVLITLIILNIDRMFKRDYRTYSEGKLF